MSLPLFARRAALLVVALAPVGCDLVSFARNDPPVFEQTWQIPVVETSMGVGDLLPPGNVVTILPDSSGFALTIAGTNISRVVGNDCGQCQTLNGTNAPKPQFILNAGNSTPLPTSVTAAAITAGTLQVNLVNNMSFDPLFVNTNPSPPTQGFMLIVVRSGSQVLARDSVWGAAAVAGTVPYCSVAAGAICNAPFAKNGGTLNRTIPISTGTATTSLTVDVTINSPLGDHNEFINANGTLDATASVPSMTVGSVTLNVTNRTFSPTAGDSVDMGDLPFPSEQIQSATLTMDITNPFTSVTGTMAVRFGYGPQPADAITKNITLPSGSGLQAVTLTNAEIGFLTGKSVELTVSGLVNSSSPVTVTPKQKIVIDNRLAVKFWTSTPGGI